MGEKTKDELVAEAHQKYVEATEVARKEYVETKRRIYPELGRPSPEEQEKTIRELKDEVIRLKKRLEGD